MSRNGSAVLTFFRYNGQTDKKTDRQAKYINNTYIDAWHDRENKCLISGNKIPWIPLTDELTKNAWNVHCSGLNHIKHQIQSARGVSLYILLSFRQLGGKIK